MNKSDTVSIEIAHRHPEVPRPAAASRTGGWDNLTLVNRRASQLRDVVAARGTDAGLSVLLGEAAVVQNIDAASSDAPPAT